MKKITLIAIVTMFTIYLSGCKKSADVPASLPPTTLQKIQGIWVLQNIISNSHYAGVDHTYTTTGTSSDLFDFRTDGKIYYSFSGYKDTITYSLLSDTKILIDGTETYDIKTLTSAAFSIYQKKLLTGSDYDEETLNWKK